MKEDYVLDSPQCILLKTMLALENYGRLAFCYNNDDNNTYSKSASVFDGDVISERQEDASSISSVVILCFLFLSVNDS